MGPFVVALEICSPGQRNYVGTLYMLGWSVGCMVLAGVAWLVRPWRWLQVAYTALFLAPFIYIWLLPESPRWLIHQGKHSEALKVLRWAARVNRKTLPPDNKLMDTMHTIMIREKSRTSEAPTTNCLVRAGRYLLSPFLTPGLRLKVCVVYYLWAVTGTSYRGLSQYARVLSTDVYLHTFLAGLVEVPAMVCLWPAITWLGRRRTLSILLMVCSVSMGAMTVLLVMFDTVPDAVKLMVSLIGKMTVTASYNLMWIYTVELFSTATRVRVLGEASIVTKLAMVAVPYINDIVGEAHPWFPSALCTPAALLGAGLVFLLPETTNKKMTQRDDISHDHDHTVLEALSDKAEA